MTEPHLCSSPCSAYTCYPSFTQVFTSIACVFFFRIRQ
uniref:Uncharacterized protein n=1 Tax=Anguilla anguilla TaxID=7936 RepID=A0A0E9SKY2_ANGAN